MAESSVMYTAVYSELDPALADLDAVEELHHDDLIGKYDAAVIDKEDGEPHVVKRMDRPALRVIPEWLGAGTLPRHDLHDAAELLGSTEAALIVVGDPTLEKAFDKAVTRADKKVRRDLDVAADKLAEEIEAARKDDAQAST
jgi:hypothetical protein